MKFAILVEADEGNTEGVTVSGSWDDAGAVREQLEDAGFDTRGIVVLKTPAQALRDIRRRRS